MPRYIDADALENEVRTFCREFLGSCRDFRIKCALYDAMKGVFVRIYDAPTLSPDEVRGGTWVGIDDFPHESWECDQCGCVVENTDDPWNYFHYCPNCGAKMEVTSDA